MADGPASLSGPTLSVVIAGMKFGYPEGSGAAARTHAYAKGLSESGAAVHVVSLLTPSRSGPGMNAEASGAYDGVPFEYACGTRTRRSTFMGRRLLEARVPIGLWRAARRHFAVTSGPRVVIAYSDQPSWIALTALVARSLQARCVVEVCEVPLVSERGRVRRALRRWLLDTFSYRFVDGFIAISSYLERYLRQRVPGEVPIIRVPILVSAEEFAGSASTGGEAGAARRVVFVGDLGNEGEVADLLEAFARIAPDCPDVSLGLVGACSASTRAELDALVARLGLQGRVDFAGWASRVEMPGVLGAATVLVLPRRSGLFSDAGFPTKLGEYLASGRPVVTTATGEIATHLTHAETAYVVPPGDPASFAAQVRYVLDHADEAASVGARGRRLALRRFDRRRHGARLHEFLCGL
jgi:glycosyltransferase involved in cell wall biosynthesis